MSTDEDIEGLTQEDIDQIRAERAAERTRSLARLADLMARFNRRYAVVCEAGKTLVFELTDDPVLDRKVLVRICFADFRKLYQNRRLTVMTAEGKKITKSEADWWLNHQDRRQYIGGVMFDPAQRTGPEYWNLWSGFAVEPRPGDWSLMNKHMLEVICSGNAEHHHYVLRWLARMVQRPNLQGKVALVLRGKKGAGKGILFHYVRRLWGQHGVYISNAKHLTGNFNAHLRDCVFLFADEAFWAGDKVGESVLKGLITDPVINVEAKYQNAVNVPNLLHIGMASNADWVVPASIDERRYFVLDASDHRIGDRAYFEALAHQMDAGGTAAMLYALQQLDLSGFNVEDYPQSDALTAQKRHSLDSLSRWWLDVLERGFAYKSRHGAPWFQIWHDTYTTELLRRSYAQWCEENRPYDRKTETAHGNFLSDIYMRTRSRASQPIYEIESIDHRKVEIDGLDKSSIVWGIFKPGYRVGDLDDARFRFANTKSITVGQGGVQGQGETVDYDEPPF
jgi:hypothetical protein